MDGVRRPNVQPPRLILLIHQWDKEDRPHHDVLLPRVIRSL